MSDKLTEEQKLHKERVAAGWFTTEWGEFRPPVVEVNNKLPQKPKKTVITENKVTIPAAPKETK